MRTRTIAILLIVTSAILYAIHYAVFRDMHGIGYYLGLDLALMPLEVLLVTIIIDRMLSAREVIERRYKLNMVIGVFFSEVGQGLLRRMADMAADQDAIAQNAAVAPEWNEVQIRRAIEWTNGREFAIKPSPAYFGALRDFLREKREFMVRLLENPMLLEHEVFTDLLWAVFHLEEELSLHRHIDACSPDDLAHLSVDAERAYTVLLTQWLEYMIYLQRDYPFLFSLAARTNPLRNDSPLEA